MRRSASGSSVRCGRERSSSSACIADFPIRFSARRCSVCISRRAALQSTPGSATSTRILRRRGVRAVCLHNRRYDVFSRLIRSDFSDACGNSRTVRSISSISTVAIPTRRRGAISKAGRRNSRSAASCCFMTLPNTAEASACIACGTICAAAIRISNSGMVTGSAIFGVGENLPAPARELFDASESTISTQAIRAAYERLGGYIGGLQSVAERDIEIEQLLQQVRHLEAVIGSYEASTSWRFTTPVRGIARLLHSAKTLPTICVTRCRMSRARPPRARLAQITRHCRIWFVVSRGSPRSRARIKCRLRGRARPQSRPWREQA